MMGFSSAWGNGAFLRKRRKVNRQHNSARPSAKGTGQGKTMRPDDSISGGKVKGGL